uniref:Plexin-B2-like n=1 Tax=Sphaeramia orbicularis TaxID=375764 RepID=A0A672Z805_9TELE
LCLCSVFVNLLGVLYTQDSSSIHIQEFTSETPINNVVQDPQTGRIYLGAVNTIFQLGPSLNLEARAETGPKEDAQTCTPPASACQDTKLMPNLNKLLLVHPSNGSLIVCGSRYRGICSLLNLTNVEQQLYYSDTKGERTYVASIEESVNVVGVMSTYSKDGHTFNVFVVGKGYGTLDSAKLISTRILQDFREWVVFESIIEASTVQTTPFVPKYLHDFRHAFKEDSFIYFLFSRTLDGTDNKNLTFISRLCEDDHHYYSHTELQLTCGTDDQYNKVQAAYVASPGKDKVLFTVASPDDDVTDGALCMYPLNSINEHLVNIISACYIDSGKINGIPAVDIPYLSKKEEFCTSKAAVSLFKCGADFLPSPLASKPKYALKAEAVVSKLGLLTAVAVAVENDHTIAFLGNSEGEVFKVKLSSVHTLNYVCYSLKCFFSFELLLLPKGKRREELKTSCLTGQPLFSVQDPYCGWCVLEGRCTRRSECRRAEEKNGWLWSPRQQCLKIVSFYPPNLSCKKTQKVQPCFALHSFSFTFSLCSVQSSPPPPPPLSSILQCITPLALFVFGISQGVKCPQFENPDPVLIPVGYKTRISFEGINLDHINPGVLPFNFVHIDICAPFFKNIYITHTHTHTHSVLTVKHFSNVIVFPFLTTSFTVTLYNCSVGRQDCSLCKNADSKYRCVWCAKQRACVYEKLCVPDQQSSVDPHNTECPDPEITDIIPLFGPLQGGISITIRGSNLGIHKDDIVSITVVGEPCIHQKEKYSVSTSVVCEIGPYDPQRTHWGAVEVKVKGEKRGTSSLHFTYRDPILEAVKPARGPKAGGTLITISGKFLDTGSKDDVQVTVGGVDCFLLPHVLYHVFFDVCVFVCVFFSGGRNIVVTGSGFDLIQTALIKVQGDNSLAIEVTAQHLINYRNENTRSSYSTTHLVIHLHNVVHVVFFPSLMHNVNHINLINTVNVFLQGRGFSKAMTAKEAQAFVGDVPCLVNTLQDDKLFLDPPSTPPRARSRRHHLPMAIKFGNGEWVVGSVQYEKKNDLSLYIIIPAVIVPMLLIIAISVYCYRRKSQQAEREYEKVKHQLENLEESVRDRCKKEFTDLMIEMEDHTNDLSEGRIPFLDYKNYTDRVFFLPSKDGANDVMITGKLDIPEARRATVTQALNQFSNLLNSKTFLINFIRTLERSHDFNARAKVYFASLLTVALHGKLEYYTDIMRTLLLELMEEYVNSKNPKLMLYLTTSETMSKWLVYVYQDSAGEPLYKLFRAIKHQIEKGPVDARVKKAKYTLNDTGLLGDDVEYSVLTLQVLVHGEGPDVTPVKVLNCDTISQVKEKIIEQVYRNLPYSLRPKVDSVTLEWRPGSTGQILSDLDLTSQKEGRWKRINTLAHYNVRDNATLVLSRVLHTQQNYDQNQENHEERNALLEDDKVFHLVRPAEELDEIKSKRGSIKDKSMTKAITEIYLTRLLSVKGTLQQFVDDFFRSVLCSGAVVPPAVKYFFDFLDEQALKHNNVDEETIHIWKTNSLPLRFWVNILKNPHFIFDVHVSEVVDASLSVIAQTFMDACTKSEHKLSRDSPSNKLLYAKEISTYKKMVDDYYKGIRQMVPVSDQDMNTHLAEVSRSHTDKLNTQVALHQLYQYASKYYDGIIASLDEDPAAQSKQLTLRLQQIAAALENKVTDL